MKLDLKNFHKIECDGKCTTLQHPNGHQIKVAHKGLSKEHREELDQLPTKMAKGGYAKFAQKFDPSIKGSKASGASEAKPMKDYPEYKMPRSEGYTEPDDIGTDDIVLKALHHEAPPFGAERAEKPHYPPCINPSCKSYGRSHPNCRCYGGNPEVGHKQGMFAEGGEVDNFCSQDRKHQKGCAYYAEGTPNAPVEQTDEDQTPQAPGAEDQSMPQQTAETSNPSAPAPDQQGSQVPTQNDPVQHAQAVDNLMQGEVAQTALDKNSGHINPKTYHDVLWKDKGLVGKIGTLFGLIVGGAGSGNGENVVLGMADKMIKNDLYRQQQDTTNEQNIVKLNQANLLNNSQVNLNKAQANAISVPLAYMMKDRDVLDKLTAQTEKLPEVTSQQQQQKALARQKLIALSGIMDQKHASMRAQAGIASALMSGQEQPSEQPQTAQQQPQQQPSIQPQGGGQPSANAAPIPNKPVIAPDDYADSPILNPNAQKHLDVLRYVPKAKDEIDQIKDQYTKAQQADTILNQLHGVHQQMANDASSGGRAGYLRRHDPTASIPFAGHMISQIGVQPITDTQVNRDYDTNKTRIVSDIANALKGTNVSGDEIQNIVDKNSPEHGDTPEMIAKKERAIRVFVKNSVNKSLLKDWGLSKK